MAVKMRLRRMGQKKAPFYRIVVADSRSPRDGRFIEEIGTYDPNREPSAISFNEEAAKKWLANGAQPTEIVAKLLKQAGIEKNAVQRKKTLRICRRIYLYLTAYAVGCGNYANLQIFFHSKNLSNQFYCVLRLEKHALRVSQVIAAVAKVPCKHGLCLVARVKKGTGNNCRFLFLSFTYCKISTTTFLSLFEEAAFTTVRIAFAMRP